MPLPYLSSETLVGSENPFQRMCDLLTVVRVSTFKSPGHFALNGPVDNARDKCGLFGGAFFGRNG